MTKEKLLAVRKQVKTRKPKFRRSQANQFAKLRNTDTWRKPKGMGNKIRRGRRGQPSMPTVGYGSPAEVRGLGFSGLNEVIVSNVSDLDKITKDDIVVISRTLGAKKKLEVLNAIKSKNLKVANVKDIDKEIKSLTKEKKEVKKESSKKTATSKKEDKSKEESKEAKK